MSLIDSIAKRLGFARIRVRGQDLPSFESAGSTQPSPRAEEPPAPQPSGLGFTNTSEYVSPRAPQEAPPDKDDGLAIIQDSLLRREGPDRRKNKAQDLIWRDWK